MSNAKSKGASNFVAHESVYRKHEFGNWQLPMKKQLLKRQMNQISLCKTI